MSKRKSKGYADPSPLTKQRLKTNREKKLIEYPMFIISLDTELLWGYVRYPQHRAVKLLYEDEKNGRGAIDALLQLFEKYNIPATWATVGHLFLDSCECEDGIPHKNMPRFKEDWYSCDPCTNVQEDPLYYGKDFVNRIISSRGKHEIGYHTFSHVPFSECNHEVATAELEEGVKIASKLGIALKSFVFPENKIGHEDILKSHGFEIYRGHNVTTRNAHQSIPIWAVRFAASKIVAPPVEPVWRGGIWELPSSMLFSDPLFPSTLVLRAKKGIRKAIRHNKIFHVFLHPENLLMRPSLANELDDLLAFVAKKRDRGILKVLTMGKLAYYLNQKLIKGDAP